MCAISIETVASSQASTVAMHTHSDTDTGLLVCSQKAKIQNSRTVEFLHQKIHRFVSPELQLPNTPVLNSVN